MSKLLRRKKADKPYRSYPLTAHNNGQWCKKICGKVNFFGVWADPQAALDNYFREAADLHAGRQPRETTLSTVAITVKDVCNHFWIYQMNKLEDREISARWFEDCRSTVESFATFAGLRRLVGDLGPDDFQEYRKKVARYGLSRRRGGLGGYALIRRAQNAALQAALEGRTDLLLVQQLSPLGGPQGQKPDNL